MNSKTPARRDGKQDVAANPLQAFRELLEKQTAQFQLVMPPETVERFKRVLVTTLGDKPDLLRCTPRSIISVAMHAASDGLEIDSKEAAIIPYKIGGEQIATYQPMVVGLRKKVMASGLIGQMTCQIVFEGDQFDIQFGSAPNVHHKPALTGGSKRKIIGAYSDVEFKNGGRSIEWMTIDQIEEIRLKSPAVKSGRETPWKDPVFYPEMCRKTVFRRHAKMLPMASDIENIFRHEAESNDAVERAQASLIEHQQQSNPPASVQSTLDDFGQGLLPSGGSDDSLSAPVAEGEQAASTANSETGAPPSAATTTEPSSETKADGAIDAVKRAYRRGQDDRKAGRKRDDMPEEFQENTRNREQVAWWCGFDGKPLPTWKD